MCWPCSSHLAQGLFKAFFSPAAFGHIFFGQTVRQTCESGTAGLHSIHFDLNSLKRAAAGASLMVCLHQQQTEQKEE